MRKLSKKMMISLMTFALVFIALGASTYAWFTLAQSAQLSDLKVEVSGGTGLEIALEENGVYKSTWSADELEEHIGDLELSDLTSTDGVTIKNQSLSAVEFVKGEKNSFIEMTFYFKGEPAKKENVSAVGVYLVNKNEGASFATASADNGTFIVSKGVATKADVAYTNIEGEEVAIGADQNYKAADAVMVSFQDNGKQTDNVKMYDFNAATGSNYNDGFNADATQLKGAANYYYQKTGENPGVGGERTNLVTAFTAFTDATNVDKPDNDYSLICALSDANSDGIYEGSVTIRIWIEGFDADCFNAILADEILTQFEFKLGYTNN